MKTTGYGKTQRRKLVSKEIKYCTNKGTDKFTELLRLL